MFDNCINFFIADDEQALASTIKESIELLMNKFEYEDKYKINFEIAFSTEAYQAGMEIVKKGLTKGDFLPQICIFDLIFNGHSGLDLYLDIFEIVKSSSNYHGYLKNFDDMQVCFYTGIEGNEDKLEETKILASKSRGKLQIITKPNIKDLLNWVSSILKNKYNLKEKYDEIDAAFEELI